MKTTPEPERSRGATHGTLELIAALADEWKLKTLQPQIAACRQLAQSRNGIDVAVFGRFKAGKSSFLNHLAGRAVLPVGVVPLTAVITRLRSGERARGEVHFLGGTTREIPLADVGLYVSENQNPSNAKRVEAVEIELPELRSLAPLQFVDTPGLGSALAHNTEVALNWLPQVGAALVAVSADAPLSERDLELLGELRRHTPKIALLLTKADLLTEAQRAEVRAFIAAQLRRSTAPASSPTPGQRQLPGDPGRITAATASNGELPIFFYSIKPELSTMRSAVLEELLEPLRARHGQTGEEIFRHKLVSLRDQLLNYLQVALAAATQAESARAALQAKLAEERRQFALFREELAIFTRAQSAGALNESLERLRPVRTALQAKLATELDAQWPRWRMRLPPLLEAWRNWLNEWLRRELSGVSRTQQAVFRAPLERSGAHLTRALQAFHDRLADHVRAALGVTLAPPGIQPGSPRT